MHLVLAFVHYGPIIIFITGALASYPKGKKMLTKGESIQVYKNLKTGSWSVRTKTAKGRRLEGHYATLTVSNATPKTSEKGALRIQSKKSREVVAWINCDFVSTEFTDLPGSEVHYNPYRRHDFHYESGQSFQGCGLATFPADSAYFLELKG